MPRRPGPGPTPAPAPVLVLVDMVAVGVFAVLGRASHAADGVDVTDVTGALATAAPFLAGGLIGALVARAWRAPLAWRSGVLTWVGAAGVGLALRFAVEGRLPLSFAVVATASLAVLILGWRGGAHLVGVTRARRRPRQRA